MSPDQNTFKFAVRACHDAHVSLCTVPEVIDNQIYEIVIGGWMNSESVIRDGQQVTFLLSLRRRLFYMILLMCQLNIH